MTHADLLDRPAPDGAAQSHLYLYWTRLNTDDLMHLTELNQIPGVMASARPPPS